MTDRDPARPTLGQLYDGDAARHPGPVMPDLPGSLGQMYAEWSGEASSLDVLGGADLVLPAQTIDTRAHRRQRRRRGTGRHSAPEAAPETGAETPPSTDAPAPVDPSAPPVEPSAQPGPAADPGAPATDSGVRSVARSSAIMAAGTLVSRMLGLVRSILLAAALGKTAEVFNIFDVANKLPNMIYILLAGGVINAVLVPQITRALKHPDGGKAYTDRLLTLALSILAVVTVVLMIASPLLYRLFDLQAGGDRWKLGTLFALFCLPQLFFYGIYTLFGEVLNARSNFGPLMWSPALANIIQIGGLSWFIAITSQHDVARPGGWTMPLVVLLAGSTTLGIVAQALVLIIPMRRVGYRFSPNFTFRGVGLGSASRVAGWAFAAVVVQQTAMFVTTNVLMVHAHGVSGSGAQSYAFMLFMLPHSLVTLSLITALYTRMSKSAGAGRTAAVVDDTRTALRLSGLASVAVMIGCLVLVPPLVATLFGPHDAFAISSPTIAMMLGIVPFTVCVIEQRVFYAYEDAKTPFWMQLICTAVASVCSVLALGLPPQWIGAGVAAAQSISYLVQAVIGFGWLRRRLGELPVGDVASTYGRLGIAAIVAAGVGLVLRIGVTMGVGDTTRLSNLLILVVAGLAFVLVYVVTARRLRVQEIDQLVSPITGRLSRLARR